MNPQNSDPAYTQPTPSTICARIRSQRKSRHLTLHDIERLSGGHIKAVVMGSYERGTRTISLARTIEIANLFGMPVSELISDNYISTKEQSSELVFDLRKIRSYEEKAGGGDIQSLHRYLKAVAIRRRDWNGEVLSLRNSDLDTLSLLIGKSTDELLRIWIDEKLILKAPSRP